MRIAFLNPHGNICSDNCYLGCNSDIGGQSVYVFELAYALTKKDINVDVFTRQIFDLNYPKLNVKEEVFLGGRLRIIRIPFGGKGFLKKEKIWPFLMDYIRGVISFYKKDKRKCDFISSHYGDGGICAAIINKKLKINYSYTAHSLGIQKIEMLKNSKIDIFDKKYNIKTRIYAERQSIKNSLFNVISTQDERYNKYNSAIYNGTINIEDDNKFVLIPPGVNRKIFNETILPDENLYLKSLKNTIKRDISKKREKLPYIISLSRLDNTKNHEGLVKAYCKNEKLKSCANLIIQVRGSENPFVGCDNLDKESKSIVERILDYTKKYNLKGKICFVNLKSQTEIAVCYRYLREFNSVFCLTSFYESFGLVYLEAMACGMPVMVTDKGGPKYVLEENNEKIGILVNPYNSKEISKKILEVINNKKIWTHYKNKGLAVVKKKYNWDLAAEIYLKEIEKRNIDLNKEAIGFIYS